MTTNGNFMHEVLVPSSMHYFIFLSFWCTPRALAKHCHNLPASLQCQKECHLFLKAEKCLFHRTFGIYKQRWCPDGQREGVCNARLAPSPSTLKEFQCFRTFANIYCSFIHNIGAVTSPLTNLLKGHQLDLCLLTSGGHHQNILQKKSSYLRNSFQQERIMKSRNGELLAISTWNYTLNP